MDRVGVERGQLGGEVRVGALGDVHRGQGRRREAGHARSGAATRAGAALGGDLPVRDLQAGGEPGSLFADGLALGSPVARDDVHGTGCESPVVDPAGVRGAHGLGELADERHAAEDVEALAVLEEVLLQAQGVRVVVEDQRGARRVPRREVLLELDHTRVAEALEHGGLAARGVLDGPAQGGVRAALAQVDADAGQLGQFGVLGLVVRPGLARVEGVAAQRVRTDPLVRLTAPDAHLFQCGLDLPGVDRGDPAPLVARGRLQHRHQFGEGVDTVLVVRGEPDAQRIVGEADRFADPHALSVLAEQSGQLLGLPVDQVQGVAVGLAAPAGLGLHPGAVLAGERTAPVLQLDHAHTGGCDDEEVHLADMTGVRGEGEVRPGPPGVGVRQLLADRLQSTALVVVLGLGDRGPPAFPHLLSPPLASVPGGCPLPTVRTSSDQAADPVNPIRGD